MRTIRTLFTAAVLAACQFAQAADIQLTNVTLSDFRFSPFDHDLGTVGISEQGNIASLDLTSYAQGLFAERADSSGVELWDTLYTTVTAAEGYAVKSVRFRAVLDVTEVNAPEDQNLNFAFYLQSPTLRGIGWGQAYDGRSEDWKVNFVSEGIDGSKAFDLSLSAAVALSGGTPTSPDSYSSVGFSSIVLDIETVPVAQVPEPASWAMLLAGLAGAGAIARRRKH